MDEEQFYLEQPLRVRITYIDLTPASTEKNKKQKDKNKNKIKIESGESFIICINPLPLTADVLLEPLKETSNRFCWLEKHMNHFQNQE